MERQNTEQKLARKPQQKISHGRNGDGAKKARCAIAEGKIPKVCQLLPLSSYRYNNIVGEWEYDFASLPEEKEPLYTPPKTDPIEYLLEELKMIWEPRLIEVPGASLASVMPASTNSATKNAGGNAVVAEKINVVIDGDLKKGKEEKVCRGPVSCEGRWLMISGIE